ncbi:unnamed protein product [Owenia fusiformis]|uniref:Serine/threonine-protein kinase ULK3 n=1 Tax=Owenia fusiformis TaxID=6347 RepID=A0A8J1TWM5_OWEFU|nr:unnamed protein product [Owenia fusiformis]
MAAANFGPRLSGFVFTEKLGSGTYATVYKAYRKDGQREVVAVKCVEKSSLNKISTENLLTEIKLLKTLKHRHIVELKDFQWDDKYIYLIMEYSAGGDLSKFIRSKRALPQHIVKKFLQQIAQALQFLRSKNVAHMDLKPQNILLSATHSPILKIADFGFAQHLRTDQDVDILRGSPLYMAPEIICDRRYHPKCDLWSVGVILYECLFGKAPFHSKSLQELEEKIRDSKPIEIPHGVQISDKCRDLLLRLLQRDPLQRIDFDDFFNHPFIDLEHAPSEHCLAKAIELVRKAVVEDGDKNYELAVTRYCQALDYFVPAIKYESDPVKKDALRERVKQYMNRAEDLKNILKPGQQPRLDESKLIKDLEQMCTDGEKLESALKIIVVAKYKYDTEEFEESLEKYELVLGALIKILHDEPPGARKDLLRSGLDQWLSRAEEIKKYLKVRQLSTHNAAEQLEPAGRSSTAQYCSIQ